MSAVAASGRSCRSRRPATRSSGSPALLPPRNAPQLALAMLEDVLEALAGVREPCRHHGRDHRSDGDATSRSATARAFPRTHATRAIPARSRARRSSLAARDDSRMLTMPGDVPLVTAADIERAGRGASRGHRLHHRAGARRLGSNAILCSPADAVPLRFGDDSFFPHLAAARACGIEPAIVRNCPASALDIDTPDDLAAFLATPSRTRAPTRCSTLARRDDAPPATEPNEHRARLDASRCRRLARDDEALALRDCDDLAR